MPESVVQEFPVVLASGSAARARLLNAAGLSIVVAPANVDEDSVRESLLAEKSSPRNIADTLAELKTIRGAANKPGFVIGADQVLSLNGQIFSKPTSFDEARKHLNSLRGATHELISAVCVAKDGSIIWRHVSTAKLSMRHFSDDFLESYMERNRDMLCQTVGGYEIEGEGIQLFSHIDGDYFTILGLPLVPLLDCLRQNGVLKA